MVRKASSRVLKPADSNCCVSCVLPQPWGGWGARERVGEGLGWRGGGGWGGCGGWGVGWGWGDCQLNVATGPPFDVLARGRVENGSSQGLLGAFWRHWWQRYYSRVGSFFRRVCAQLPYVPSIRTASGLAFDPHELMKEAVTYERTLASMILHTSVQALMHIHTV